MAVSYANPVVLDRVRKCLKKRRYGTEARAWQVAMKVYRATGELLWAFKCGHCNGWHNGHPQNPYLQRQLKEAAATW
jgi:hypothetical protein